MGNEVDDECDSATARRTRTLTSIVTVQRKEVNDDGNGATGNDIDNDGDGATGDDLDNDGDGVAGDGDNDDGDGTMGDDDDGKCATCNYNDTMALARWATKSMIMGTARRATTPTTMATA